MVQTKRETPKSEVKKTTEEIVQEQKETIGNIMYALMMGGIM